MPRHCYVPRNFSVKSEEIIGRADEIISEYSDQGYNLTLRQLYYQFVSRDLLPNTVSDYKRLGSIINDARLAGYIDWNSIEDRTRNLAALPFWGSPAEIVDSCASQFRIDKWETQPHRVEVWIEKEALAGVFERVCHEYDVPFLCCRGYTSQSEMWGASQRLIRHYKNDQPPLILHFGDHDPSGIDMTRDIRDRLRIFGCNLELKRLALNMDQVNEYNPPPNPAKETDTRFAGYIREFGAESWELDALEPPVLAQLVRDSIDQILNKRAWKKKLKEESEHKKLLGLASENWDDLAMHIQDNYGRYK